MTGKKTGGRSKGTVNKATATVLEIIARSGYSPIEGLLAVAMRRVSCGTCVDKNGKPTGRTSYALVPGAHAKDCKAKNHDAHGSQACTCNGVGQRQCASCDGSLLERIDVPTKLKADSELAQYVAAKRKAIEHSLSESTAETLPMLLVARRNRLAKERGADSGV